MWDDAGSGCNVAVPNLPRREVGRAGVYWLALGPSARTSGGRLGTATLLRLLVVEGVLSHTLTFECVGQCSWKVLNCRRDAVLVQVTGGKQSTASPLCTRAVVASEPDVLVTLLAIERAGDYDLIGHPVVHDGLVRLQTPRHGHVECVSRVLLHGSRPELRATGVTRLGPDGVFLYFDLALSSHCGFFRASVFLERSLLQHSETRALERRCPLCAGGPPVDFLSIRTLSRVCTHRKGLLTEVRDCDLLIDVTSSTFLKRKDMLKEKSS